MNEKPSRVVQENIDALIERERAGRIEHGDDMDRTDYRVDMWLDELISESLDSANYGRKLKHMMPKLLAAVALLEGLGWAWGESKWAKTPSDEFDPESVHSCSYRCQRPECIRRQRDELAARVAKLDRLLSADDIPQLVTDAVVETLCSAYDCNRAWEAWNYGTMSQDDFSFVSDDPSRVEDIARAVVDALRITAQVSRP